MNYFGVLLTVLMPLVQQPQELPKPTSTPVPRFEKIHAGITEKTLLAMWGDPIRVERSHNFYSDKDVVRYFYLDDRCQYIMHACTVDIEAGRVSTARDVSPKFID